MEKNVRAKTTTIAREEHAGGLAVLCLEGPLRWPVSPQLRRRVEALLALGERTILLDFARVEAIDAAGLGELVELWGLAHAAKGELWIDNADRRTRTLLDRAGLLELLSLDSAFPPEVRAGGEASGRPVTPREVCDAREEP